MILVQYRALVILRQSLRIGYEEFVWQDYYILVVLSSCVDSQGS
jgi:hypothetical protein